MRQNLPVGRERKTLSRVSLFFFDFLFVATIASSIGQLKRSFNKQHKKLNLVLRGRTMHNEKQGYKIADGCIASASVNRIHFSP